MKRTKKVLNLLTVAGATALGYYLYRRAKKRGESLMGNFSPIVESIRVREDGELTEIMTFDWDDEEQCSSAHSVRVGPDGKWMGEKLLQLEYSDDRILVVESDTEYIATPHLSTLLLDHFGMGSTVIRRSAGGKEQRFNLVLDGNELQSVVGDDVTAELKWEDGNLRSINCHDGSKSYSMTYYKNIENHLFPDLNLLFMGLSDDLLNTYLKGSRSINFVRTINIRTPEGQTTSQVSYLMDHFDRPVQVLLETTEVKMDVNTKSSKEYDVIYYR